MKKVLTMIKTTWGRYKKSGELPTCKNCGDIIEKGDKYINNRKASKIRNLYCLKCAKKKDIVILNE